jgi:hypothetical protein
MSSTAHFELHFYLAVLRVLDHAAASLGSLDAVFQQFPFLACYNDELARHGMNGRTLQEAAQCWRERIHQCEQASATHLPIRALARAAHLDDNAITLLMMAGLVEEDPRFAGLVSWPLIASGESRAPSRRLVEAGLLTPEKQVPTAIWDALRGDTPDWPAPWLRYRSAESLPRLEELIVDENMSGQLRSAVALLEAGRIGALILRGPRHNGRRTAVSAVARALGRGVLDLPASAQLPQDRWVQLAPLSVLLHALPCIAVDAGPGEAVEIPELRIDVGPMGIVLGRHGGVSGPAIENAVTLSMRMPGPDLRRSLWQSFAPTAENPEAIAAGFRLPSGRIRKAAALAATSAALDGRPAISPGDVREACHTLHRHCFDTLAVSVDTRGSWRDLAVSAGTESELRNLELRCRYRERIAGGPGVRALLKGPSGTGKTLAAKLLASALEMDLYRVDLSTVVNKYIGETEKNLNRIFTLAEELDVILFLDEGDALLTQRTGVQTSNDRYANLETNYLLQRIEGYEGILVIATNAADRIDTAFQRRMDVVISFQPPETAERWSIWQLHLDPNHSVDSSFLSDLSRRCVMTGGQIRNAVLHASLLAMEAGSPVTSAMLQRAVEREYRKSGGVCPLRTIQ